MYSKLGYTSVQLGLNLEPMSHLNEMLMNQSFWTPSEQEYYRAEMKKHVDEISSELDRKLILHMFSNGGTQVYMSLKFGIFMLSLVFGQKFIINPYQKDLLPEPSAYIFDSAPGSPGIIDTLDIPGKIFRSNNPSIPLPVSMGVSAIVDFAYCFRSLLYPFRQMDLMPSKMVPGLHQTVKSSPCLVLYGTEDDLIQPKMVHIAVDQLRSNGCNVETYLLNGKHCMLMRENPELYPKLLTDFIQNINP